MVVLSDGVAQRTSTNLCRLNVDRFTDACFQTESRFAADGGGNCCGQDAIVQAQKAKSTPLLDEPRNYKVFSIALTQNYGSNHCGDTNLTKLLGRLTLLRLSSEDPNTPLPGPNDHYTYYKEASSAKELNQLYKDIAQLISSPTSFYYFELPPD